MSKPRKLPSGNWNIRVMVNGKSYSFTDPDKRTVKRMAAAFADQCREDIDNPKFIDAISDYIDRMTAVLSPASIRGYRSIEKMLRLRHARLCQKRLIAVTDRDIQTVIDDLSFKTAKNYVGLIQAATKRKYDVVITASRPNEMKVPDDLEIAGLIRIFEGTEMEIPVLLAVFGGLRRGEICALTMQDIDGDYVIINKDMVKDEFSCWVVKQPKTQKSNRRVLLPHYVIEKIRAAVKKLSPMDPLQMSLRPKTIFVLSCASMIRKASKVTVLSAVTHSFALISAVKTCLTSSPTKKNTTTSLSMVTNTSVRSGKRTISK